VNVLTGFKFIGEVIGRLEDERDYVFGFEESYGYLSGSYVRDKDGVDAAFLIAEMFAFYKTRGVSLLEKLDALYAQYGYCLNTLHSYTFPGSAGMEKMAAIMADFHRGLDEIGGERVLRTEDYSQGIHGLPKSDVLKFFTESGSVVVRPSGTEPKLKAYLSVTAENREKAREIEKRLAADLERKF
jgi:phosphoglucomutase